MQHQYVVGVRSTVLPEAKFSGDQHKLCLEECDVKITKFLKNTKLVA